MTPQPGLCPKRTTEYEGRTDAFGSGKCCKNWKKDRAGRLYELRRLRKKAGAAGIQESKD